MQVDEDETILRLENIVKVFPGVKALDGVNLDIKRGEVHSLCGENGAGKSTLMKIISGAQTYTQGKMWFEGKERRFSSTKEAQDMGISMIYQEFNLIPYLSIAENLFLGRQPMKRGFIDWKKLKGDAKLLLQKVGLNIDPTLKVKEVSVAEAQMIEIAKCLSFDSKVIIMDEPTAALTDDEIEYLFNIIKNLKRDGISIIYISHRMEELFKISDRITVFRDGKHIKTMIRKDTDYDEIVRLMVGKDISNLYPQRNYHNGEVVLAAKNISMNTRVREVSFELHRGEILGIAGLLGSGKIHLSKILYGCYSDYTGEVCVNGKLVSMKKTRDAISNKISLVPDDRKNEGLVLVRNVRENISLASLNSIVKGGFISYKIEKRKVNNQIENLRIKVSSSDQIVENLSGGNQQKVVFAKMLETMPDILILDEPTRGVDVGAKGEIYNIINALTNIGISIILVSSDLPELIGMSDRIIVMREGRIVKEIDRTEANQEVVLAYAAGGVKNEKERN